MIQISETELENTLKELLQKNLHFRINGKVWRQGRLLLFKQSGFFLELIINSTKKPRERFEIPIPFETKWTSVDLLEFNYDIRALTGPNEELISMFKSLTPAGKNRFYNSTLYIEIQPDVIV